MEAALADERWLSGRIGRWWRVGEGREIPPAKPRLLDQVRAVLRLRHYSRRKDGWIVYAADYYDTHPIREQLARVAGRLFRTSQMP